VKLNAAHEVLAQMEKDGKLDGIINKSKTRMEGKADLVFHDSIGKILKMIAG